MEAIHYIPWRLEIIIIAICLTYIFGVLIKYNFKGKTK